MQAVYYVEVLSSWCHWVEPVWAELQARYAGRVRFEWRIALMRPEDLPTSRAQCDWYYRRSGGTVMQSPYMLSSAWLEPARRGDYAAPNLVAEAGRELGVEDDRIRLALAHAALREGARIGDAATAVAIAAKAARVAARPLARAAASAAVRRRVEASTAEFLAQGLSQRPAFVFTNEIGDRAVFSGLVRREPLVATVEAMLADAAAYAAHAAHHPPAPTT